MAQTRSSETEQKRSPAQEGDLPGGLAKPAMRALANAGYSRLEQLAQANEAEISKLHGMGPKAMEQLRRALEAKGLSFGGGSKA